LLQGNTKRRSAQKIEKDGAIAAIHGQKRADRPATIPTSGSRGGA